MRLRPGQVVEWHSTRSREELLIALAGRVRLELRLRGQPRALALSAGQCAFLARGIEHRVVNRAAHPARYLYVTG